MRCSAWIAGLWLLAVAQVRAADRLPLELTWQAPAECPSADQVRAELERVARARAGFALTPLTARAQVTRTATAYSLRLATEHDGEHGERELAAGDCNTLVRTLTLVLALAFGAGVEVATSAQGESGEHNGSARADEVQAPNAATAPANRSEAGKGKGKGSDSASDSGSDSGTASGSALVLETEARQRSSRVQIALFAGGGAQLGLMPTAAFGAFAGAELGSNQWSLGLRGALWPSVARTLSADLDAHFSGFAAALHVCGHAPIATFGVALCGVGWVAALRGRANGSAADATALAPWYALGTAAAITWPRESWLAARLEAGLAASLDRPRFVIENLRSVHRVPALVGDVSGAIVVTP